MSIGTILLHMAPDEERGKRLDAALALVERFGAHLHVIYMTSPAAMPTAVTGRGASAAFIAESTAIAHEKAAHVKLEVESRCQGAVPSWEWEILEGDHNKLLAQRSHYADMAIVSENHGVSVEEYIGLHMPDELLLQASCPVLMLPRRTAIDSIGKRVMIAWKNTREAARAVRGSLDILHGADQVTILTLEKPRHRFEEGRTLAGFLGRHGIECELVSDVSHGHGVGEVVLTYCEDMTADLLIMGAYGHHRWREIAFGGTTHHVLKNMQLPVLTDH